MPHSTNRDADLLLSRLAGSVVALLFFVGLATTAHSQEITYNLTPTHKLGDEIWRIPIGGRLTMSADGSKMLVASIADSAFFVVNTTNGEYRKLKARYVKGGGTFQVTYATDANLTMLVVKEGGSSEKELVWNIDVDTLLKEQELGRTTACSPTLDVLATFDGLYKISSAEKIATYPEGFSRLTWIDEQRNRAYFTSTLGTLIEYDATTGEQLRTWTIRPMRSEVRRPSNSDWIYLFSIRTEGFDTRNLVEAINLETNEHIVFTDYYWSRSEGMPEFLDGQAFFSASSSTCLSRGIDNSLSGSHGNAIFEFDADVKRTDVVLDQETFYRDRSSPKGFAIMPDKLFAFHCWVTASGDSSNTVCQALVPNTVSVAGEEPGATDPQISVAQTPSDLHITLMEAAPETIVENITLITTAGQTVVSMPVQQQTEPTVVPIAHVASGAYLLVLQTSQGQLSTKLLLAR